MPENELTRLGSESEGSEFNGTESERHINKTEAEPSKETPDLTLKGRKRAGPKKSSKIKREPPLKRKKASVTSKEQKIVPGNDEEQETPSSWQKTGQYWEHLLAFCRTLPGSYSTTICQFPTCGKIVTNAGSRDFLGKNCRYFQPLTEQHREMGFLGSDWLLGFL